MIKYLKEDDMDLCLNHLGRAFLQTLIFHYGLKLRASVGRLPDKDLSEFLVKHVFKGGAQTMTFVLFVLFRSIKSMIERGYSKCIQNTQCASWIAVYLLILWAMKIIIASIQNEWRKELSISTEQIAMMQISWVKAAQGFMVTVMAACGAFLFALINAENPGPELVLGVGVIGTICGAVCFISEVYEVTRQRVRRRRINARASDVEQPRVASAADTGEHVAAVSWWFVAACNLVCAVYTISMTIRVAERRDFIGNRFFYALTSMVYPIACCTFAIGEKLLGAKRGAEKA